MHDPISFIPDKALHSDTCFIISYGIHGNETAPIECCQLLIDELRNKKWKVTSPVLFLLGNPEAMKKQVRFCNENLNRLFSLDSPTHTNYETDRAEKIKAWVNAFINEHPGKKVIHYDLHTAIRGSFYERFAIRPFVANQSACSKEQLAVFHAMGIDALLEQHQTATTFSSWTALAHNATSFTLELGQVKLFGENDLSQFENVMENLRSLLGTKNQLTALPPLTAMKTFKVCHEIIHSGEDFIFYVDDAVENFTAYPKGTLIWKSSHDRYVTQHAQERIVFPNKQVPQGQRAGLMIIEK